MVELFPVKHLGAGFTCRNLRRTLPSASACSRPCFPGFLLKVVPKTLRENTFLCGPRTEKFPSNWPLWLDRAFRRNRNLVRDCWHCSQSWERSQGLSALLQYTSNSNFPLDRALTFSPQKIPVAAPEEPMLM